MSGAVFLRSLQTLLDLFLGQERLLLLLLLLRLLIGSSPLFLGTACTLALTLRSSPVVLPFAIATAPASSLSATGTTSSFLALALWFHNGNAEPSSPSGLFVNKGFGIGGRGRRLFVGVFFLVTFGFSILGCFLLLLFLRSRSGSGRLHLLLWSIGGIGSGLRFLRSSSRLGWRLLRRRTTLRSCNHAKLLLIETCLEPVN
mmetsp:Transcript_34273/g.75069  ORF Transcript_34273/g.75069 Transcript_34273/m.75069 type:complete len:201 (-) Transcript_34273:253-855(-)